MFSPQSQAIAHVDLKSKVGWQTADHKKCCVSSVRGLWAEEPADGDGVNDVVREGRNWSKVTMELSKSDIWETLIWNKEQNMRR